ncbi:DUF6090 family protein [Christiangramia sp. SM2212]|uniref:DUF6090 family protein n=1 Tax=Christiangramia sediminicola TaxID=3073267 RepID=A0ABU1ERG3_9FLAO|nr:DUF6090 family protein [Christiangramia sp. SM2212]MDR5590982.1 DUF6090 family protein [Christiangramia sp. SM2212]
MIKLFRNIRRRLLRENRFTRYLIYAIGEIVLVVIGILIALQINNWNENRKQNFKAAQLNQQLYEELERTQNIYIQINQNLNNYVEFLEYIIDHWNSLDYDDLNNQLETYGYSDQPLSLLTYITWYSQFNDISNEIYNKSVNEGSISLIDPAFVVKLSDVYVGKKFRLNQFIEQEYELAQNITKRISEKHGELFKEGDRLDSKDWDRKTYLSFLKNIQNDGSLRFLLDSKLQLNQARALLVSWQINNIQNTLDQFPPTYD